jgi:cell division protein FtsB
LGTVAVGSGAGGFLPMSQLQQQVSEQRKQLRDQHDVITSLRARLAKLEELVKAGARRK